MENVRGGSGPAKRLTAWRPTARARRSGSAIAAARDARRTNLFIAEYARRPARNVYRTLVGCTTPGGDSRRDAERRRQAVVFSLKLRSTVSKVLRSLSK